MKTPDNTAFKPSSGTAGFFQSVPRIQNQWLQDESLNRIAELYLPKSVLQDVHAEFKRFGEEVLSKHVIDWVSDAERNLPYVKGSGYDSFGHRVDELVTSEGWKRLQELGLQHGIVANGYTLDHGRHNRLVQFLKYHLWSGSSATVTCPSAMQDGAAAIILSQLSNSNIEAKLRPVLQSALERLTSTDPVKAWTSGQWMTERTGGSDVSQTETVATFMGDHVGTAPDGQSLGPWRIDGFKWFSSATDSAMTVLLARTSKGLSCFFAPTKRIPTGQTISELNGIKIQRLKSKLGTRALPTAELELNGMRAWLLGREGEGIKMISTMLNITRLHNSVTSVGVLGRGLAISKSYAAIRKLNSAQTLDVVPLFAHTISKLVVEYHSNMQLTFFVAYLLGMLEHGVGNADGDEKYSSKRLRPRSEGDVKLLLRILTPIMKARTAKSAILGLQECMESLGGVGYLENEEMQQINVARLFRDANVLSIWEGTTDVLASGAVKTLKGRDSLTLFSALSSWIANAMEIENSPSFAMEKDLTKQRFKVFRHNVDLRQAGELLRNAREIIEQLGDIICMVLLIVDAESDGDEWAGEICRRFCRSKITHEVHIQASPKDLEWDRKIAFHNRADRSRKNKL